MTHDTVRSSSRSPADLLEVRLAAPQRHGGLTVFPLLAEPSAPLPCVLLADALAAGSVTIGEVGSGTVPSLLAHNRGKADVLILDGEQLIGARQNRITNRTILLAAGGKTEIPVSCMEQGRWHFTTGVFATAPKARHAPAMVRRHARAAEAEVAAATGRVGRQAAAMAQGAVWSEIADYAAKLGGRSDTGAMDDVYRRRDADVESWLRHFPLEPGQVGVLAFLEGMPLGLDAIGCPELFARLHARFLGGYVMDALAADGAGGDRTKGGRPGGEEAERFLAAMGAARRVPSDTVGKGQYRVLTGSAIGGELTDGVDDDRRLVHLSGFPPGRARTETGMAGPAVDVSPFAPPGRRKAGKPRVE
jgi:hypothetical protein